MAGAARTTGAVHGQWTFTDFVSNPLALRRVAITPIQPYGLSGNNVVIGARTLYTNDSSGVLTVSNMVAGFSYRVEFIQTIGTTIITNCFDAGVSGLVDASDYLCTGPFVSGAAATALDQAMGEFVKTNEPSVVNLTNVNNAFIGSGAGLTSLPRHDISSVNLTTIGAGTSAAAVEIGPNGGSGVILRDILGGAQLQVSPSGITATGNVGGLTFTGGGFGITNLNGTNILGAITNNTSGNAGTASLANLASFVSGLLSNSISGNAASASIATNLTGGTMAYRTNTTERKVSIAAFGAAIDGKYVKGVVMVAGTNRLTTPSGAFAAGDVGKLIRVPLASTNNWDLVTTISSITSATNILLANSCVLGVTNTTAQYGSDERVALQSAINFCTSNNYTLVMEVTPGEKYGVYLVGPTFQDATGSWTNHAYAQLIVPPMPSANFIHTLRVIGNAPPASGGMSSVNNLEFDITGIVVQSAVSRAPTNQWYRFIDFRNFTTPTTEANSATTMGGVVSGTYRVKANAVHFVSENMRWMGCQDNNMALLDLHGAETAVLVDTFVDTGIRPPYIPNIPNGTNGFGVVWPAAFNENLLQMVRSEIRGFFSGMDVQGGVNGDKINIQGCANAITTLFDGGNPNVLKDLHVTLCKNVFKTGPSWNEIYAESLVIEDSVASGWWSNPILFSDAAPSLCGRIWYRFNGLSTLDPTIKARCMEVREYSTLLTGTFPAQRSILNVATNMITHNISLYGSQFPTIFFGTNTATFHSSGEYQIAMSGPSDALDIFHNRSGTYVLRFDTSDNVTIGAASKTVAVPGIGTAREFQSVTNRAFCLFPSALVSGGTAVTALPVTGWTDHGGYFFAAGSGAAGSTRWQFNLTGIDRVNRIRVTGYPFFTNATPYELYCTVTLVNTNGMTTAINNVVATGTAVTTNIALPTWTGTFPATNYLFGLITIYGNAHASGSGSMWLTGAKIELMTP